MAVDDELVEKGEEFVEKVEDPGEETMGLTRSQWRRRWYVLAAVVLGGLLLETVLRLNDLLPSELVSQLLFGGFIMIGLVGTVLMALTAPEREPEQHDGPVTDPERQELAEEVRPEVSDDDAEAAREQEHEYRHEHDIPHEHTSRDG